ncbi:MAG: EAL domain-containing protein [Thauera phenolivorans]|uniref:EAL domain-containing protein n=1 Tax=Thauera phenolivorans TaxID=1792543 RepID=A0A7X7LXZ4_9RHOO|nr:EAL domain-containing protein [Thauera phenolivorans]
MTLTRQLWLAITLVTTIAVGGSLAVSLENARHYLEQELRAKNIDTAGALALSLSLLDKDPLSVELRIAAQFDTGHYRLIRLVDPEGNTLVERSRPEAAPTVPAWFVRLVPIAAPPGLAQVQAGWRQYGTLTVDSHDRYAYASLWSGAERLLTWLLGLALACGAIGTLALHRTTRPLRAMVAQARDIGERRFTTIAEPTTAEFRSVVRAMNTLSERVRKLLDEEARRLEALRRRSEHDELTGVFNRAQFLRQLDSALARDDDAAGGSLALVRVTGLDALNRRLGRGAVDDALARLAKALAACAETRGEADCGRLNASDFALLVGGGVEAAALADTLQSKLQEALGAEVGARLRLGACAYLPGEQPGSVLARADATLAAAELGVGRTLDAGPTDALLPYDSAQAWRAGLEAALDADHLELAAFPVLRDDGSLLHEEAPVRLLLEGRWRTAAQFLPWAARLDLLPAIDARVFRAALQQLEHDGNRQLAINLSAAALCDAGFRATLYEVLRHRPGPARRLWIEVQEAAALRHQVEFRSLCIALRSLGCRIGLDHGGKEFSRFAGLHELGLDYLKIDAAFVRGIDGSPGNQSFVRSLCSLSHALGLLAIAEGVSTAAERGCLLGLGADGITGPAARRTEKSPLPLS